MSSPCDEIPVSIGPGDLTDAIYPIVTPTIQQAQEAIQYNAGLLQQVLGPLVASLMQSIGSNESAIAQVQSRLSKSIASSVRQSGKALNGVVSDVYSSMGGAQSEAQARLNTLQTAMLLQEATSNASQQQQRDEQTAAYTVSNRAQVVETPAEQPTDEYEPLRQAMIEEGWITSRCQTRHDHSCWCNACCCQRLIHAIHQTAIIKIRHDRHGITQEDEDKLPDFNGNLPAFDKPEVGVIPTDELEYVES